MTFVPTGIMGTVWASQRRRPKKWMTTYVWSVNEARRAAQRSCTASVRHHMTSPSKELRGRVCACVCVCVCMCVCFVVLRWNIEKAVFSITSFVSTGFTLVVIDVRTGTMVAVWESSKAKPITSTSTCVHNVSRLKTPWQSSRRSLKRTTKACGGSCVPYRLTWHSKFLHKRMLSYRLKL